MNHKTNSIFVEICDKVGMCMEIVTLMSSEEFKYILAKFLPFALEKHSVMKNNYTQKDSWIKNI